MLSAEQIPAAPSQPFLAVEFLPTALPFSTGMPVLDGCPVERLFPAAAPAGKSGCFALFRAGEWLLGAASVSIDAGFEAATRDLYADLFSAVGTARLARIWNHVPAINEASPAGLENYRAFSRGRSEAFETRYGPDFRHAIPSASAVGTDASELIVLFAATDLAPRHVENPRQIPAYDYPPEYGPRPPSFARATVVPAGPGGSAVFVSGTSSIRGHETVAPDDTAAQVACTLANLREISAACGCGEDLARGRAVARHFKVYLRHAGDCAAVQAALARELLVPADRVSYLRSDICRRELNVEIEATLLGVAEE